MTRATEGLARSVQTRLVSHAKAIGSDPNSAIRVDDRCGGKRVTLHGELGKARLRVQVDVGMGDVVVPAPEWLEYPSLLGFARPRLRAYHRETVVAEKVHAMVVLGSKNSRLRDFFDVQALAQREAFDGPTLTTALRATFERRTTPLPDRLPLALTQQFGRSAEKQSQWRGFLRRTGVSPYPGDLGAVVDGLARFLRPPLEAAAAGSEFQHRWPPGGPWTDARAPLAGPR
jgi:hypothetical protein